MKINKNRPTNPSSSVKTRFAVKFIKAMKNLNKKRPIPHKHKRYLAVRAAACASMASAVGPRRAWSRAVLNNIRNRRFTRKRSFGIKNNNNNPKPKQQDLGYGEEDELRRLVPGGKEMDFCRLLSESAHYIECLRDQVQVMTNMLHHYSS
ncbi:hypothetical protein CASFOL_002932 [Castilleja foliolosa]|uniref:IBH1-like N-terminal domain-containing protein n=1 Tax=Castilleja foliolosa TaxID=1961234 RepID=A0ABD3EGE5_9LAMI